MASAFTLTLAYLSERCSAQDTASAFAAYITGNVASNLVGRLMSAGIADHFGLAANFVVFAGLNLTGAILVYFALEGKSATAGRQRDDACLVGIKCPFPQRGASRRFRHRLLHPLRLHRHLHLR